jgi:outer membrane receptor for ferrienterochelin and colicin
LAAYQAHYRDLVGLREITRCVEGTSQCRTSGQLQNLGEALISGVQAQLQYHRGRLEIFGNYSFTDPYRTDPRDLAGRPLLDSSGKTIDRLRIGDIASHRVNVGFDLFWSSRLSSDLRVNYVGPRKTGAGTTVPTNPFTEIDSYVVTNATLSYRLSRPATTLQLIVGNLFDVGIYHPGVSEAGIGFAARIPQPGRRFYVRLLTGTPGRKGAEDR